MIINTCYNHQVLTIILSVAKNLQLGVLREGGVSRHRNVSEQ